MIRALTKRSTKLWKHFNNFLNKAKSHEFKLESFWEIQTFRRIFSFTIFLENYSLARLNLKSSLKNFEYSLKVDTFCIFISNSIE